MVDYDSFEYDDIGTQRFYYKKYIHRLNAPAIIWSCGQKEYYHMGKCHRTDGPAVVYPDGYALWYVNHNNITDQVNEWLEKNNITYPFSEEERLLFILNFI